MSKAVVQEMREGEVSVPLPKRTDARLVFIGRIRTPYATRKDCPRQAGEKSAPCRIEIDPQWQAALTGLEAGMTVQVLYWLHESRRDLVLQSRRSDGRVSGTFALRSPIRPNPIASSLVEVLDVEGSTLIVRGLDCIDGTPLLDVKPGRCPGR